MRPSSSTGLVLGIVMASYRSPNGEDHFVLLPGDDVEMTFPTATSGTGRRSSAANSRSSISTNAR